MFRNVPRLHLNSCVVFVGAAILGALFSMSMKHYHRVTDSMLMWNRSPHAKDYASMLKKRNLVRTPDTLGQEKMFKTDEMTVSN